MKRLLAAAACVVVLASLHAQPRPFDILITNARIVDGTGGPSLTGAVAVRDGRIAGVGRVTVSLRRSTGGCSLASGMSE